nr:MAG TPA: hypothetical protein [Caudoviricetes sp.]
MFFCGYFSQYMQVVVCQRWLRNVVVAEFCNAANFK